MRKDLEFPKLIFLIIKCIMYYYQKNIKNKINRILVNRLGITIIKYKEHRLVFKSFKLKKRFKL